MKKWIKVILLLLVNNASAILVMHEYVNKSKFDFLVDACTVLSWQMPMNFYVAGFMYLITFSLTARAACSGIAKVNKETSKCVENI